MAGNIEKRDKNGYRLTVSEGFDLSGKPMIHRKTIHRTKKMQKLNLLSLLLKYRMV